MLSLSVKVFMFLLWHSGLVNVFSGVYLLVNLLLCSAVSAVSCLLEQLI